MFLTAAFFFKVSTTVSTDRRVKLKSKKHIIIYKGDIHKNKSSRAASVAPPSSLSSSSLLVSLFLLFLCLSLLRITVLFCCFVFLILFRVFVSALTNKQNARRRPVLPGTPVPNQSHTAHKATGTRRTPPSATPITKNNTAVQDNS